MLKIASDKMLILFEEEKGNNNMTIKELDKAYMEAIKSLKTYENVSEVEIGIDMFYDILYEAMDKKEREDKI